MGSVCSIFQVLSKFGLIVKLGKIFWNAPALYRFAKHFGPVAKDLITNHRLPSGPESQKFLRDTAVLLRTEIVDFPGVDEQLLADKMEELAIELDEAA